MIVQRVKIGVLLNPRLQFVGGPREQGREQIKCAIQFAKVAVEAGNIVLGQDVVRIDGQGARGPFLRSLKLSKLGQRNGTEIGRARVLRIASQFAFGTFHPSMA